MTADASPSSTFHLSLPVSDYALCLEFYRSFFGARVVELSPAATNLVVFGGQLTLHDRPDNDLTDSARRAMHFGAVVPLAEWINLKDSLTRGGVDFLLLREPGADQRGKFVVIDPGGNLVEINTQA